MGAIKKEQIIVRVSPRLKTQLEKKAEEKQMSLSELIRMLIEKEINQDN